MLWELFLVFLKVGCLSFGGGYAVMTVIQRETAGRGWLGGGQFEEIVALAGMAPGSIATNTATLIGYSLSGIGGAIVSTLGMILPSLLVVVLITAFFFRSPDRGWMRTSFYGLRPIVTGLIVYAALHFGLGGRTEAGLNWTTAGTLLICAGCLVGVLKYKIHPFAIIALSAVAGIVLF